MKPAPSGMKRAGELKHADETCILRHGDMLYRVTAASARDATAEVLACIGDPSVWRGEIEAFTETLYREMYGEPGVVVEVPDVADAGEPACPVCRPGAVADDARPVRYALHGGDLPDAARR